MSEMSGRNLARKIVNKYVTCCQYSGNIVPILGNLSHQQLHADFLTLHLINAGPVMILNRGVID